MATESLHLMTIPELRRERQLAQLNRVQIEMSMKGTTGKERFELEEARNENREYVEIINARIARLERVARN